ncbi:acyl-CoA/acyl-ACP dehydrogenase [Novosphingobium sp. KCTC 2891]|uniref:acyl-CoA dehydrogenase family protein n=1 Tax=unclassified Novosphingobium TaxID=2644732 RepID=UPI002223267D|nr:acyl-CoA dehydrogenase family protein [Novosphingobium sp. KCTC 2891]MCW1384755.1 acyl-CoA/acyl-ACP dehydrogenase [Novosphingobium sp. KCTC 2891]
MSILYDEGQQAIATESRRVLDARANKARLLGLLERVGAWDEMFWNTAVEQGWTALAISEEHGGLGLGLTELGLVAQATGAATAGAPFLAVGHGLAHAVAAIDDAALQAQWLPRLAAGDMLGTVAFGEGSSPLTATPAVTFADGILNGAKDGVTGGLKADIALVWALADGEPALVLAELAGADRTPVDSFDNARLIADITFAATPARLIARGAEARELALDVLARMAVVTAHEQVGGAEALLFIARDYANTRRAFGQVIGAFQSVKHRIAELYGLVEIARANCIHAAARAGQADFLIAAADARISATDAYDTAARDCVQVHGGIGVTWEQGLHLHMRRARSLAIEQGNMLFWEDLLVERLTGVAA